MPIYAYKCESCGHTKDVLQKMSDAPLTDCPQCGATATFKKQLTAAGFQLKGSGWYVTDFRGGDKAGAPAAAAAEPGAPEAAAKSGESAAAPAPAASANASAASAAPSSPSPSPAPASSGASSSSSSPKSST